MKLITKTSMLIYLLALYNVSYWIGFIVIGYIPFYYPTNIFIAKFVVGFFPAFLICTLIYMIYILLKMRNSDYGN